MRYKKKLVLGQLVPNSYLALMEEINKLKVSSDYSIEFDLDNEY